MDRDKDYLEVLLSPLRITAEYRPKLGQGTKKDISAEEFSRIYSQDAFYRWLGLDSQEVYVAHRVAGGITSLYRQIGIGCERLVCRIFQDVLGLSQADLKWSYEIDEGNRQRTIYLDACIPVRSVVDHAAKSRLNRWIKEQRQLNSVQIEPLGIVFEIRQGYKSKDSKRQNADLLSASRAYQSGYLPCMLVLSRQIDSDVEARYRNAGWIVLTGDLAQNEHRSTYAFLKETIGYDLAAFLERNQQTIRERVAEVLQYLLSTEES